MCSSRQNLVTKTFNKATKKKEARGMTISHKLALSLAHDYLNFLRSKQRLSEPFFGK
jgi:hypothetical protein